MRFLLPTSVIAGCIPIPPVEAAGQYVDIGLSLLHRWQPHFFCLYAGYVMRHLVQACHPIAIALRRQDDVDDARVTKRETLVRRGKQLFKKLQKTLGG